MDSLNESLKLSLAKARQLRREGVLKRASKNLYQDVITKDFWRINKESGKIERCIETDEHGFVKE